MTKNLPPVRLTFIILAIAILVHIVSLGRVPSAAAADENWRARYWNNRTLSGDRALARDEAAIDHDWGDGSPSSQIDVDDFSAQWTRTVYLNAGTYRFTGTMDDGMRAWVDDTLIIDSWTDSQVHSLSADVFLSTGEHDLKVEYYEAGGKAVAKFSWQAVNAPPPLPTARWRGVYFPNKDLSGQPGLVRDDNAVSFNWKLGSPWSTIPNDRFSARWTRVSDVAPGNYGATVTVDDGVRLWVNEQLIIDQWHDNQSATFKAGFTHPGGPMSVRVEYFEHEGAALIDLQFSSLTPGQPSQPPAGGAGQGPPTATVIRANSLAVRSTPEITDNVIGAVAGGETVLVLGRYGGWIKVRTPGNLDGWAGASYLETSVPLAQIPVLAP